ncbi:APC family permease [Haliangium sp.]|uniref:APC family permease n=1 Tax=Haliangium sp. TaxID=2663208 RepID=UPI003D11F804
MSTDSERNVGLLGATTVGVGAIVGGGILVLAGITFVEAGPASMVAFALNGVIAFLTALSFAEISSSYPESGGAYLFAKKVLSVRAAFAVGWVLWFAYIVAGVLYAVGFASYAALALGELWRGFGADIPAWLHGRRLMLLLASLATLAYAGALVRKASGGGQLATYGKLIVFAVLILAGAVALVRQPLADTGAALTPFFAGGLGGLLAGMGVSFIALQGFDLIAAIAGEVKRPAHNIPRAMFLSLGLALVVYLPLLFVVATTGVGPGESIRDLARDQPETVVALAAGRFMGPAGYWLVIVAAVLSTLSALHANLLAASRVAQSMARDHTLPAVLGDAHPTRGTPIMAVYATTLTLVAIIFMVPDLAGAGAAASLIFLLSFTLAHITAYLARTRGEAADGAYRTPWFPLVPAVGGLACAALAIYQALAAPVAAAILIIWLGLGALLYVAILSSRAESSDASAQALDPALVRLRGHRPRVLVPVANPAHAEALVAVANALVPSQIGRVLLLTVVPTPDAPRPALPAGERDPTGPIVGTDRGGSRIDDTLAHLADAQKVIENALATSYATGQTPEALITAAPGPWDEIRRVADEHGCECLLLGLRELLPGPALAPIERLINQVDSDVAILRAPPQWRLAEARRVLVSVGGRGEQHELRARLLGSIMRTASREVTFLRVVPAGAGPEQITDAQRAAERLARANLRGAHTVRIASSDDVVAAVVAEAADYDLLVLGLQVEHAALHMGRSRASFGDIALDIARRAPCATVLLSGKRSRFIGI